MRNMPKNPFCGSLVMPNLLHGYGRRGLVSIVVLVGRKWEKGREKEKEKEKGEKKKRWWVLLVRRRRMLQRLLSLSLDTHWKSGKSAGRRRESWYFTSLGLGWLSE